MQEIIINYYPEVVKQIKEIQQIARAEDIEFHKIRLFADEIEKNTNILTANKSGVARWEKMLGIKPKESQSIEERKLYIYSQINRRKMSLSELETMLMNHADDIVLIADYYTETLNVIIGINTLNVETIFRILDTYIPMHIYIRIGLEELDILLKLFNSTHLEMETTTEWQWTPPASAWRFDGSVKLNGCKLLNAVKWEQKTEIIMETVLYKMKIFGDIELEVEKDMWKLDGSVRLDGSRLLDAELYREDV